MALEAPGAAPSPAVLVSPVAGEDDAGLEGAPLESVVCTPPAAEVLVTRVVRKSYFSPISAASFLEVSI